MTKKKQTRTILIIVGIILLVIILPKIGTFSITSNNQLGCNIVVSEANTNFVLDRDLLNCPQFGIMINANNVTVDCNGHKITGNGWGDQQNPYNSSGKENCTVFPPSSKGLVSHGGVVICSKSRSYVIKNCVIEDFWSYSYGGGIVNYAEHDSSTSGLIENNIIRNVIPQTALGGQPLKYSQTHGIMQWGEFDIIRGNTLDNLETGIWLDESSGNTVTQNTFIDNDNAINHYCGPYCDYKSNPTYITNNIFNNNNNGVSFSAWEPGYIYADYVNDNTFTLTNEQQVYSTWRKGNEIINIIWGKTSVNGVVHNGSPDLNDNIIGNIIVDKDVELGKYLLLIILLIVAFLIFKRYK